MGRRRFVVEVVDTHVRLVAFYLFLHRIRKRVERDSIRYSDPALIPIEAEMLVAPARKKQPAAAA